MPKQINEHHFNIEDAKKYGVKKAILLYNLRFWINKNKANDTNKYKHSDGKEYYWTYNSSEAFEKLFPYFSASSIRRWLDELEKEGVLISNNFNDTPYNHTKWYAIAKTSSSIDQNNQSSDKNGQSTYTDNKPDSKHNGKSKKSSSLKENSSIKGTKAKEVLDYFHEEYKDKIHEEGPVIKWKKAMKLCKSYLDDFSTEQMKEMIDTYFSLEDKFYRKEKWSVDIFLSSSTIHKLKIENAQRKES